MTVARPCILDIEASGFGRHSYPIEVGYVLPDGRARCTLIRPPAALDTLGPGRRAGAPHQPRHLLRHGRPTGEVARMLNDDLAGRTVYCDGWAHDYPWLAALFDEAGLAPVFKLESVRTLLDDAHLAHLPELQRQAPAGTGPDRHRASADARALQLAIERAAGVRTRHATLDRSARAGLLAFLQQPPHHLARAALGQASTNSTCAAPCRRPCARAPSR
jgi:hypothetical protein